MRRRGPLVGERKAHGTQAVHLAIGPRFAPYGARFQIGQAINRSKWGVWNVGEYVSLVRAAEEILRREPGVELLGPSVIDFEYHVTAGVLNLRRAGFHLAARGPQGSLHFHPLAGLPNARPFIAGTPTRRLCRRRRQTWLDAAA